MELIQTTEWMKQLMREARAEGRIIGFVPTMGALHEGHLSLVRAAQKQCKPVAVSVFVNPKQFGPKEDLNKYPRQLEADKGLLESLGVEYLFAPSAAEMYPPGFGTYVNVEGISEVLEGRSRPGHFRGVTTVVLKLLEIVGPRFAYFGRKDAQQARVVERMVADLNLEAEIVICPIVREADGLAISSRNAYLKPEERRAATVLNRALRAAQIEIERGERDAARLTSTLRRVLDADPLASTDYAAVVDAGCFEPVVRLKRSCYLLLAVFIGTTRLIDNLFVEESEEGFHISL